MQPKIVVPYPVAILGLAALLTTWAAPLTVLAQPGPDRPPNIVIVFADDLGYGDLGIYGHPTIRTPNLDRMAAEGLRFTQFYSAASVCTPSRAALMTGRFPVRSGMASSKRRVLFPDSKGGLPASEITLAEALKEKGYATGCFGKWHLGHLPPYLPTANGFDTYFGIPYSNDMDAIKGARTGSLDPNSGDYHVPLLRDTKEIERSPDQTTITRRYTEEAVSFIVAHKEEPFLVYLPHSMPHVPLFRSDPFVGKSARGLYGDVLAEIDWSVGKILDTLRTNALAENTLVFFTSDNGPWLIMGLAGGSAGLLREGKGSTWEGGMREPAIAWWPGRIPSGGVTSELGCTMDLFTTCLTLAGAKVPADRPIDGLDLSPVLFGDAEAKGPRDSMIYYRGTEVFAARKGAFKAHFITQSAYGAGGPEKHDPPVLFNLDSDPSETTDVAKDHPDVIAEIRAMVETHAKTVEVVPSQLEVR
jgi:arylsulfatase A